MKERCHCSPCEDTEGSQLKPPVKGIDEESLGAATGVADATASQAADWEEQGKETELRNSDSFLVFWYCEKA